MKIVFYSVALLGLLYGVSSCTQESDALASAGTGKLAVNIDTDLTFRNSSAKTTNLRSIDETEFSNIRNYTVTLEKTAGNEQIYSALYSEWALAYEVESNVEYRLTASYGQAVPASYDNLLVKGSEVFTVQAGSTKVISFQCKPQAAKVNVIYSDDFETYFSDCIVSIKTKHMDQAWTMSKVDEGKDLFLQTDEEENVELAFDIKDKNGESVSPDGFSSTKNVTVNPQTLLKLTIKPDVTEIEGGKFGINVSVNTDVTDEDVNIVIPNDIFNN